MSLRLDRTNSKDTLLEGWHLPTCKEFETLVAYFGNTKESAYQNLISPNETNFNFSWSGLKGLERKFSGVENPGLFGAYLSSEEK